MLIPELTRISGGVCQTAPSSNVGRMGRLYIGGAAVLIVLFALQCVFVGVRTDLPAVAALHPLNDFLILLVGLVLGRAAWKDRPAATGEAGPTGGRRIP